MGVERDTVACNPDLAYVTARDVGWGNLEVNREETHVSVQEVNPGFEQPLRNYLDMIFKHVNKVYEAKLAKAMRKGGATDEEMERRFRAAGGAEQKTPVPESSAIWGSQA